MNKKEGHLIKIFRDSVRVAKEYVNGSVWGFLGSLEATLAYEAQEGKDIPEFERIEKAKQLSEILRNITKELE